MYVCTVPSMVILVLIRRESGRIGQSRSKAESNSAPKVGDEYHDAMVNHCSPAQGSC